MGLQTLGALSTSCPGLTSLNLSGCKSVTDAGITQLAAACTVLRRLDLTRCHGPLRQIRGSVPAQLLSPQKFFPLGINDCVWVEAICHLMSRCVKLGDAAYAAIAQHCTQLQELRLYASMPSARAVLGFSALQQLQLVDICGAHQVTGMPQYSVP